ncbi:hypothetical protein ACHAXH_007530 [Discostella pseudostelligera]
MRCIFVLGFTSQLSTVSSFSTSRTTRQPLSLSSTTTTISVAQGGIDTATDFWGRPRSREEIVDFVSDAVFNNEYDVVSSAYDGNTSPSIKAQNRWVEVISAEPPLLIIHGFLEQSYCDDIVDATLAPTSSSTENSNDDAPKPKHRLKRSTMGNEQTESGHRTSSTAWLHEECCTLPLRTFATRAAALSCLPPINMENLQVVRYEPGEEFRMHTDHLDSFNEFDCGGRLCTCLVYLNDSEQSVTGAEVLSKRSGALERGDQPFTGGETMFPEFHAAIQPKKGSALFFFNTLERPGSMNYNADMFLNVDSKLRHAGMPVLTGEKWVANRWIHPRNFGAGVRGLD